MLTFLERIFPSQDHTFSKPWSSLAFLGASIRFFLSNFLLRLCFLPSIFFYFKKSLHLVLYLTNFIMIGLLLPLFLRAPSLWDLSRLVSIIKRCLKKTVGKASLNFYELQIDLSEIELILNSRPLNQLVMMIPTTCWRQITFYLGINCTRSIQTLNTVMRNFKSIYQNVLNMSKRQLNISEKGGEQNMSHHWANIKNYINRKPKLYQAKMI